VTREIRHEPERCRAHRARSRAAALKFILSRNRSASHAHARAEKICDLLADFFPQLLHRRAAWPNIRAALRGVVPLVTSRNGGPDPLEVWHAKMKNRKAGSTDDPGPRLQKLNEYLEKNFPDFFAEARFQVGEDDYFLYARFGQYLARAIEKHRAPRNKINRGFTVLNKMARASAKDPGIRQMLVSGPLEYIVDAPKARALARKRLSPVAQSYMEGLCE
jgi:hypothetical protein